jgi:hypothetical protein
VLQGDFVHLHIAVHVDIDRHCAGKQK